MKLDLQKYNSFISKNSIYLVMLIIGLFVLYFYSPIVLHPTKYILNDKGDAIKNYFCYEWHIQNDSSFYKYTGTNYPFGEHHGYTDGNPLLGNFIRTFSFLKPYSIAIFNLTLLSSLLFCGALLFKILRLFDVSVWFSIISSVGITILCPQTLRLNGHFALSYSFSIPLIIFLLLKHQFTDSKKLYTFLICISLIGLFFIHPYLGMICSSLIFLFWIFIIWFDFKLINIFSFLIQSVLPVIFYLAYIKLTDNHLNRSTEPYGFLYFTSSIETVFISTMPPFRHMLSQIYKIKGQNWEGIAYIGVTSLIGIFTSLYLLIKKRNLLKSLLSHTNKYRILFFLILSSLVLLCFSMGYPFKWNLENLLDYFNFVKQFRAPGRFAWAFYFVATLFSAIFISNYLLKSKNQTIRYIICSAILLLFIVEGIPYHKLVSKNSIVNNCFNKNNLNSELKSIIEKAKQIDAQAIISLPFFHIGSDYYYMEGTEKIKQSSFIVSYHTKIPLTACLTPRASITETRDILQLFSNSYEEKKIKNKTNPVKPFLILYSKENLNDDESFVLSKSERVFETENYILLKISPSILFKNESQSKKDLFSSKRDSLFPYKGHYITEKSFFNYLNFDSLNQNVFTGISNKLNLLCEIPENSLEKNVTYEISFWYYSTSAKELFNILKIQQKTADSLITIKERNVNSMPNTDGRKTIACLSFQVPDINAKYLINLQSSDKIAENHFIVDNLIIRRKNVDAYRILQSNQGIDSLIILNNFVLGGVK